MIGLASLSGPILLLAMLDHGIHVSPDSYTYLGVASNLAHGKGWTYPFNTPGAPLTVFPPLYSLFLSAGYLLHLNVLAWAESQTAVLIGILELVGALGLYRSTDGSLPADMIGMVLVLVGVPVILSYSAVLSETLFYPLELSALFLLASHVRTRRTRSLLLAAASTSLCMLTRYSGLSVFLCGCAIVILWPERRILDRVRLLAIYAGVSLALSLVWSLRNLTESHSLTGGRHVTHDLSLSLARDGLTTMFKWFFPQRFPGPWGVEILGLVALAGTVGAIGLAVIAKGRWGSMRLPAAAVVLLAFSLIHFVFLLAVHAFSSRLPPLNDRILGPAHVSLSLGIVITAHAVWTGSEKGRALVRVIVATGMACVLGLVAASARSTIPQELSGSSQSADRLVELEDMLRGPVLDNPGAVVYANASSLTWYATGKQVVQLPLACKGQTVTPNYDNIITALGQRLRAEPRMIVVLSKTYGAGAGGRTCPNFSLAQIERDLRVNEVANFPGLVVLSAH